MNDVRFDRLTRRFVLAGLAGGPLAGILGLDAAEATKKRKGSKRKRCRKKKRTFCAGRCCPKGHRCEHKTCIKACDDPLRCDPVSGGGPCSGSDDCFCTTVLGGGTACLVVPSAPNCFGLEECGAAFPCPAGEFCALCQCSLDPSEQDALRCMRPCPS